MEISWLLFLAASAALIATPGQDMILVMSRSVTQGQAAGVVTALGVSTGLVVHTAVVALGLGVVLQTSEWLFFAVKLLGAAYLVYLGLRAIASAGDSLALSSGERRSLRRLFFDGAFTNISNPKYPLAPIHTRSAGSEKRLVKARERRTGEPIQVSATPTRGFSDPPEGSASKAPLRRCASWKGLAIPGEARLALALWRRSERVCIGAKGY